MTVKKIPCEIYSRVVGYMRPIQEWNKGKKAEFYDRHTLSVEQIKEGLSNEKSNKKDA